MAALSYESGMADDHAAYPLPSAWGPGVVRSPDQTRPHVRIPPWGSAVCREVDPGPPLRQAWTGLEISVFNPKIGACAFFHKRLNSS